MNNIPVLGPLFKSIGDGFNWLGHLVILAVVFLHGFTGDWGLAIILLTVIVRIVMIPLTWKQTKSMLEMQRIQPKLKELQNKYKKDPEKLQSETMKFYQDNKVNPFGGCLPLLIQLPIFIALYQGIRLLTQQVAGGPVSFWVIIPNLTLTPAQAWAQLGWVATIPYLILVLLFSASIYFPQQMIATDPQQKNIALIMAVVFIFFGWSAPAAVLLYWVVSSGWQVGQQWLTMRGINQSEGAKSS